MTKQGAPKQGETGPEALRRSPLHSCHVGLGAKMVPFGGWEMPLSYPSGTIVEHMACRERAVAFDVSHLGTVRVEGAGALDLLQRTLTADLARIAPGRAQYTHLLDEADASVLDDIIVWWIEPERFDVMPNASNTARVRAALGGRDVTAERAVIAIQGPRARDVVGGIVAEAAAPRRFSVSSFAWQGQHCTVAGTGYTGEDGVECALPADVAPSFWEALMEAGLTPAGLGARDTLRLEAGLPLHGHELGPGITPLQARLGWVVSWDKVEGFIGKAALERERSEGPRRLLAGLATEGRQPPRAGAPVFIGGDSAGEVTSGNFSPVLGRGIALALLRPGVEPGTVVEIELRGRRLEARVVDLPFVSKKV